MSTSAEPRPLILLVEDDTRAARRLAKMLSDHRFQVQLTVDGTPAISRLNQNPLSHRFITEPCLWAPAEGFTRHSLSKASQKVVLVHPSFVTGPL